MEQNSTETVVTKKSNGFAVAAVILGAVGLVFGFIPFLNYASGILPFLGLIFGIIALTRKGRPKTMALIGTILSALAGILTIIMVIVYTAAFASAVNKSVQDTNAANNTPISVLYEVTGASTNASITYATYDVASGTSGTQQATNQTLPFSKTVESKKGFTSQTLFATNAYEDSGDISCKITIDGKVVAEQTSTGSLATVSCSATSSATN